MTTVLMVAEKPSLAQSLANILSNGRVSTRKGMNGACSVHEYHGFFGRSNVRFKFTSVCGHVMSANFGAKYRSWDKVEPKDLFDCPTVKEEANPKLNMVKFLQKEARGCEYLVLWLDCDKEGENICFEVIDAVSEIMQISFNRPQTVFRAKFSAITERDVKAAMNNLVLPNQLESMSVDARQEVDLRIGCAFTRFQTQFFQGKYGDLDSSCISFGPCQTPTLGFCVERHDKILSFKPEPYWVLQVSVRSAERETSTHLSLEWDRGREFDNNTVKSYLNHVKSQKRAKLVSISKQDKVKQRPTALNTVELMKVASSGLGMGPQHAMSIAERLYTQGYISYPRTETTHYSTNFDLIATLRLQASSPNWGKEVTELLNKGITKPRPGQDAGDHPPITPMKEATQNTFSDHDSWRLYDYITRHFIGTLTGDMRYEKTTLHFVIGNEKFSKSGSTVTDLGFTKVMPWQAMVDELAIPSNIKVGEEFLIVDAKLVEKKTSPPDYLTESELIGLMEKHGIGTDASIPTHINNISVRNYVKVSSGRRLVPTQLGIVLIHGYQKIDKDLVLPTRRAAIEKELNEIALGRADFQRVLKRTIEDFRMKFNFFVENINLMDKLFEESFSSLADSGKPISRCGKCLRYIKLIIAKQQRLYCPTCDETFSIPQNGNYKTFKELKCPVDNFELLYFTSLTSSKSFVFCPNCYNNPPFENMEKASGCNACTHQTCKQSMVVNSIAACNACRRNGTLVLDVGSGTKSWTVSCNKCDYSIVAFKDATKVLVEEELCQKCNNKLFSIEFKPGKSKLTNGSLQFRDCLWCSNEFKHLTDSLNKLSLAGDDENVEHGGPARFNRGRGHHRGGRGSGRGGAPRSGNSRSTGERGFSRGRSSGGGRGKRRGGRDDFVQNRPQGAMRLADFL